jgi:hypothetical protein
VRSVGLDVAFGVADADIDFQVVREVEESFDAW